jgi:hypothetical protein
VEEDEGVVKSALARVFRTSLVMDKRRLLLHLDLNFNSNQILKDYELPYLVVLSASIYFSFRTNHGPFLKQLTFG